MSEATKDVEVGVQPLRFAVGCVVVLAALAFVLDLRKFGLLPVVRIGTPAATLTLALLWLDGKLPRKLGSGIVIFLIAASVADIVWGVFLP